MKYGHIWLASCLLILSGCSKPSETVRSAPPVYVGVPAALMDRCVVRDVALNTTGDLVVSRNLWKQGQEICAARIDAIRAHDAKARATVGQ